MAEATSRSPSPPLPPPTPSTPGPRATALQKLYSDAITHILKTCSYTNFASCYPTPSTNVPASMRQLHDQFTQKLAEYMRREFENILVDRNVIPSLNELDRLIEDAKRRKARAAVEQDEKDPVPPHTLPAQTLYISHLAPSLKGYDQEIRSRQEALAGENQELIARVLQQRKDLQRLMEGLEGVVEDLNGSVKALVPEEMEGLKEENREVDEVMRD
ncbi:hypothetical protein M409DRAFT_17340 [Zasmidium cellare ATCC 36951]|uniref:MIND kinetochore complex component Nnf1 n=1 Tax=Zasmidium cellare ATCC 36951 TaxID=1080233 RepID=A0A6A6D105_ZASCE|nr:uncharacterized protein M409DRAFT_17340 [Zasmidium cellare ATCC 36951]KAF2172098.1 hypothetical protein M409DRAFT_17340 [Zasmidium cellare ATCC 36951]